MRYQRIHVLGGPGSGKTYIAAKIAASFGFAAYDLDDLFWDASVPGYGVKADKDKRDQALAALIMQDTWVRSHPFSTSSNGTMPMRRTNSYRHAHCSPI